MHLNIAVPPVDERTADAVAAHVLGLLRASSEFTACTVEAPLAEEV